MKFIFFVVMTVFSFQSAYADEYSLGNAELSKVVGPIRPAINQCYFAYAGEAAGRIDLEIEINRKGTVFAVHVLTPGLNKNNGRKIGTCVWGVVKDLKFPARTGSTIAQFAYVFQKTRSPGDGPQLSCWKAAGCPGQ